jgi:hypothetical protein
MALFVWWISLKWSIRLGYLVGFRLESSWTRLFWTCLCEDDKRNSHSTINIDFTHRRTNVINVHRTEGRWDFKFSRRRVWSSESSGMYCHVFNWMSTDVSEVRAASIIRAMTRRPDDGGSTYIWNAGRHSIKNTAVHPRRFWASVIFWTYKTFECSLLVSYPELSCVIRVAGH